MKKKKKTNNKSEIVSKQCNQIVSTNKHKQTKDRNEANRRSRWVEGDKGWQEGWPIGLIDGACRGSSGNKRNRTYNEWARGQGRQERKEKDLPAGCV